MKKTKQGQKKVVEHTSISALLQVVVMIAYTKDMNQAKMAKALKLSVPSVARLIKAARNELEIEIIWAPSPRFEEKGEYRIDDFGLIDVIALRKWAKKNKFL